MAQTQSIYNNPLSGNLGNQTYKNYGGKQVVTTRFRTTSAKGDGASRAQRDTRMLMPNLTLIGSQITDWLPAFWENNKFFKRPYTHFISHNMKRDLLVLPKELIDAKQCIWSELQISCGTLPIVQCKQTLDGGWYTSIALQSSANVESMSIADFSKIIIEKNPDFRDGDFIVIVKVAYEEASSGAPYTAWTSTPLICAIQLNTKGTGSVAVNKKGANIQLSVNTPSSGSYRLGAYRSWDDSYACIHVRKVRGSYLASSQTMSWNFYGIDDMEDMRKQDYLDYCAASWGYKDKIL